MDTSLSEGNPAGPPAVSGGPRWTWALVIAAVATAVAIMAVAVVLPAVRPATAGSGGAAPPVPEPPARVDVLDEVGVAAVVRAVRAGGPARTVVTSAGIDTARQPKPLGRECEPSVRCSVVGVLEGLDPATGTVAVAERTRMQPIPLAAPELRGPVALRITASGPLEFLGHVDLADGDTGAMDVAGLRELEAAIPDGRVIAASAWLTGVNTPRCAARGPSQPPAPFDCYTLRAFLTDEAMRPTIFAGRPGVRVVAPDTALLVQHGAYPDFAPNPVSSGLDVEPRDGLYLVRMVVLDTPDCPDCRGWLMVGRLDALPGADPAPSSDDP